MHKIDVNKHASWEISGISSKKKVSMITHKRPHTDKKPYQCDICGKKFSKNAIWK